MTVHKKDFHWGATEQAPELAPVHIQGAATHPPLHQIGTYAASNYS